MLSKFKIKGFRVSFVLRHRWEKDSDSMISNYQANNIKMNWQLGIWAKRYQVVGRVRVPQNQWVRDEVIKETFSKSNLVNNYMIGLDLIVCKVWVSFTFQPTFGEK